MGSPAAAARHPDADRAPRAASPVEPLRHRPREAAAAEAGRFDGTDAGRQLERPGRARNGKPEHSFRPQRPPRPCLPGGQSGPARAEPASRQPEAPRPRALHPGGVDQRAGRRLDPVRGARLDEPRHGPRETHLARARQGRHLARSEDGDPEHGAGPGLGRRRGSRPSTRLTTPTGGTARRSTGTTRPSRSLRALGRTASSTWATTGFTPRPSTSCSTRSGPAGTSGWASPSSRRSSHASTTRSATRFAASTRDWSDQQLYDKARLVNAAVMAKIHTVEWTPAVIAHPTTETGMHANWYGLLGEADPPEVRADRPERRPQRHPRLTDEPSRGSVLPDRGVRLRLPHAPAHSGRVRAPVARRGCARTAPTSPRSGREGGVSLSRRSASPTPSTPSGSRTPARSSSTTTRDR